MIPNEDAANYRAEPKPHSYHYTVDENGITPPLGSVVDPEWVDATFGPEYVTNPYRSQA